MNRISSYLNYIISLIICKINRKMILFVLILLSNTSNAQQSNPLAKVSVIFHVIYSNRTYRGLDTAANQNDNLTTALLLRELNDLKQDFLNQNLDTDKVNPVFKHLIGNPNIEFILADTVFQLGEHAGIKRVYNKQNGSNLNDRDSIIDHTKYLNIYIGNIGPSSTPSEAWKYSNDAIYLDFQWVGKGYRLLTHEAGHWLGLLHVFGGQGKGKGGHCKGKYADDGIHDTPMQSGPTDGLCDHCPPIVKDQACGTGNISNYNNFMDYSGCRKMFTLEQCKRMQLVLTTERKAFLIGNTH